MVNTETKEDKGKREEEMKKENERWKDYASALLIAIPVLLAGIAISNQKTALSIASGLAGFVGLVLVVFWYGREKNYTMWTKGGKYPTFLYYASFCIGVQVGTLAFAIWF